MIERCEPAKHLFIAMSCLTGEVKVDTTCSLIMATTALTVRGIKWSFKPQPFCPYLFHARNMLATAFYRDSDATDMLFWDSDVACLPEAVMRIAGLTRPFVAGVYPKKTDGPEDPWPVNFAADELWSDDDGLIEAAMVPTGFLRLNRAVFDLIKPVPYRTDDGKEWLGWFDDGVRNGVMWGEDPDLCQKWRAIGGKIHMIPDITFNHVGTKIYEGNWAHWMRARQPEKASQAA